VTPRAVSAPPKKQRKDGLVINGTTIPSRAGFFLPLHFIEWANLGLSATGETSAKRFFQPLIKMAVVLCFAWTYKKNRKRTLH
jgi:hypothetical protein